VKNITDFEVKHFHNLHVCVGQAEEVALPDVGVQEVSTFSQFLHTDCQFFASLFADSDSDGDGVMCQVVYCWSWS